MTEIKIPYQYPDSFTSITIDRKEYFLRFTYNHKFDYWVMGIYDVGKNPISVGMKLVPNYPINHYCKKDDSPTGIFSLISYVEKDAIGMEDVRNGRAELVYIAYNELPPGVRIYEE